MLEVRPCVTVTGLEALHSLRYHAYLKADHIKTNPHGTFVDAFDDAALTFGAYLNGEPVGSVRFNQPPLPCAGLFPQAIRLARGHKIAEMSRMAVSPTITNEVKRFRIFTALARETIVSAIAIDIDYALLTVRDDLAWFYERVCGFEPLSDPTRCDEYNVTLVLMGVNVKKAYKGHALARQSLLRIKDCEIEERAHLLAELSREYPAHHRYSA